MRLVRINAERVLNLDLLTDAHWERDDEGGRRLLLSFAAPGKVAERLLAAKGDDADRLWEHLVEQLAADLSPADPGDSDYDAFKRRGGTLSRRPWDALRERMAACHHQPPAWWDKKENQDYAAGLERELLL